MELSKFSLWFKINKLSLNIKKTSFVLFHSKHTKRRLEYCDIRIDNTPIERVYKTKFLGVIINEVLSWHDHITHIKQKIAKNCGIISRIRYHVPDSVLLALYTTLIYPYLDYCNLVWATERTTVLNQLFVCQKKAVRLITKTHYRSHTAPLFKKLAILPVHCINDLQLACFMYRCVNNLMPSKFSSRFLPNSAYHAHNTRNSNKLHLTYHRLHLSLSTVCTAGVKLWNSLSTDLICNCSLQSFTNNFRTLLLGKL